jgi:hypothetical protein
VGAHFACLGHAQSVANFLLGKTALLITKIGRMKKAANPSYLFLLNSCKIMFEPCLKYGKFFARKDGLIDHENRNKETKNAKNQKNIITLERYEIVLPFSKAANPSNPILLNSCKIIIGPCPKCGNFLARKDGLIDHKNRNNENEKCKKSKKYYNTMVRFLNFDLNLFLFKCF